MAEGGRVVRRIEDVQGQLEIELTRLMEVFEVRGSLRVSWQPDETKRLAGEVRNGTIFVYKRRLASALDTVRHEFIDYLVSKAVEPYKEIANSFVLLWNNEAYRKKEELVEGLCRLLQRRSR